MDLSPNCTVEVVSTDGFHNFSNFVTKCSNVGVNILGGERVHFGLINSNPGVITFIHCIKEYFDLFFCDLLLFRKYFQRSNFSLLLRDRKRKRDITYPEESQFLCILRGDELVEVGKVNDESVDDGKKTKKNRAVEELPHCVRVRPLAGTEAEQSQGPAQKPRPFPIERLKRDDYVTDPKLECWCAFSPC